MTKGAMGACAVNNFEDVGEKEAPFTELWSELQKDFRQLFSEDVYLVWFAGLRPTKVSENSLTLLAPNEFAAIWIRDNYKSLIECQIAKHTGRNISVALDFADNRAEPAINHVAQSQRLNATARHADALQKFDEIYSANSKNTFESFVIGPGNQLAQATCIAVARNPGKAYNPLFLYGATGLGKTHLLQAIAHEALKKRARLKAVYISTEKFTNEFIKSIQENRVAKFREMYRGVDLLLIDDIHFIAGKERIQEEFFHTFNALFESQRQICLCSDRPASEITGLESRLVSRFQWGFIADIQAPDLETRTAILQRKATAMNLELAEDVIHLLAKGVASNVRRLEGALNRVAGYMALKNCRISVADAQDLLKDFFSDEQRTASIGQIQRRVADHYRITLADMLGKKRPARIAFPRQVAMYLSRLLTSHSLQRIGSEFGGKDHGTVIHACKAVEIAIEQNPDVKRDVKMIREGLR
ncbi:MAG: chromosomal replication initiator protein DnaA [Puniceicoccales bacterium]|jgi:chromosomal replication initiator protein|nr:chromosomal replication initiator protein DnaA [Puniceicoccales bacterium]